MFYTKIRPHPVFDTGPCSTIYRGEDNSGRLRCWNISKLVILGFQNTLPSPVGFYFFNLACHCSICRTSRPYRAPLSGNGDKLQLLQFYSFEMPFRLLLFQWEWR